MDFINENLTEAIQEDYTTSDGYLIFNLSEEDFEEVESLSFLAALDELFEE